MPPIKCSESSDAVLSDPQCPHKMFTIITRSPVGHTMPHIVQSSIAVRSAHNALPTTCSHKPHQSQSGRHTQAPLLHRYQELPIPERITSDAYIHRLLGPTHNVKHEVDTFSHYDEPAKRLMGKLCSLLSQNVTPTIKKNEWRVLAVTKMVD